MKFIDYPDYVKKTWLFFYKLGAAGGCHQMPERSFRIFDMQFPVCARCTGVYLGQIIAIPFFLSYTVLKLQICFLFLAIMFCDWLIQFLKIKESTNSRRFITGIIGGIGLMGLYFNIFKLLSALIHL
jgi:uncharacterized membrane protein